MSRTQTHNDMSLHENTMDRVPGERSESTDSRQRHRLYPSLPNIDRYEVCVADPSTGDKRPTAAVYHTDRLLEATQSDAARSDVRMKAQILILEEQRQELLCINERWAKEYRTMLRYYKEKVQGLKASLQHERSEEEMCEGGKKTPCTRESKDKESTQTVDGLQKAEKEAKELRAQNTTLTRRGQHQHEEIIRLNKALDEALQTTQPLDVSSETLQVWKQQAEVYKEDFLKERKDRVKLKEKYLEQEKKFQKVYRELHVLKCQLTRTPPSALECTCTNRATNWEVRRINQHLIQLQRR
ncbi:TNFAIP3-interacting protein 3 [Etheostoma spectabile]|uniref:TNFAIP3-interacting protein 3 n=1 Tax=Etheostoma spectabile TaxID=54343 RepID=UPI0013AF6FB7|nr:TNFAIP3-interacting protein 3-like [Etheostoma spectabile]